MFANPASHLSSIARLQHVLRVILKRVILPGPTRGRVGALLLSSESTVRAVFQPEVRGRIGNFFEQELSVQLQNDQYCELLFILLTPHQELQLGRILIPGSSLTRSWSAHSAPLQSYSGLRVEVEFQTCLHSIELHLNQVFTQPQHKPKLKSTSSDSPINLINGCQAQQTLPSKLSLLLRKQEQLQAIKPQATANEPSFNRRAAEGVVASLLGLLAAAVFL